VHTFKVQNSLIALFLSLLILHSCKKEEPVDLPIDIIQSTLPCNYFDTNRILVDDTTKVIDYVIDCVIDVKAEIQIQPGVVIQFKENAGITISSGFLKAVGTAQKPILFTGSLQIAGSWKGIYFQNPSIQNELVHAKIEYAGGSAFDSNGDRGSVIIFGTGFTKINQTEIANSGHYGFNAPYNESNFEIKNSVFKNGNKAPINIEPEYIHLIDKSNTFLNNAENFVAVQVNGGSIQGNVSIAALTIPYRVYRNSPNFDWLTIADGLVTITDSVKMEFEDGLGLDVSTSGGLKIINNTSVPVLLTGVNKIPGSWTGIYYEGTSLDNRLENVVIEFTGSLYDSKRFGVALWNSARLTINNATLRNINGCGILDYNGMSNPNLNLTITNASYINVSGSDICYP